MIIGIDGNEANVEKKVGVSVYTQKLLEYFSSVANQDTQFIVYLQNIKREELPEENKFYKYKIVKGPFLWSQLFLPIELFFNKKINVFFSPAHYSPRYCPVPLVTTIHDLSYYYYADEFLKKDLYKLTNWTKDSVQKSTKIIAVSKNTKKDILKHFDIEENKIEVVYNGYEKKHLHQVIPEFENYILYVGTIQPRKNLTRLIEAFILIKDKYPDLKLLLAGKRGWLYSRIFQKIVNNDLEKRIIHLDYVSDSELVGLYKHAKMLVLPSLYEGFGIPVLGAMSYGCPVAASYSSSLPEIGGDAALYFDPENVPEIAQKIEELLNNKKLIKELVEKGLNRVKLFSWEKCGRETLEVIRSIKS
jgi:glycosyltransferase involved in cell wall biosynthesis